MVKVFKAEKLAKRGIFQKYDKDQKRYIMFQGMRDGTTKTIKSKKRLLDRPFVNVPLGKYQNGSWQDPIFNMIKNTDFKELRKRR